MISFDNLTQIIFVVRGSLQAQVYLLIVQLLLVLGYVHCLVAHSTTYTTINLIELVLELLTQILRA